MCVSRDAVALAQKPGSYLPTVRLTLPPFGSRLPACGLWARTWVLFRAAECLRVTVPTVQCAFLIFVLAAPSVLPTTFGTRHGGLGGGGGGGAGGGGGGGGAGVVLRVEAAAGGVFSAVEQDERQAPGRALRLDESPPRGRAGGGSGAGRMGG